MKETSSRFWVGIVLLSAAVLLVGCDNVIDNGIPSSSFTLVSGSGTLTVKVLNADGVHHNKTFMFGTTSTGEPLGSDLAISSNNVSETLEYSGGGNVVFTGGYPIVVGGFIDDGDSGTTHMPDDGDYLASKTVTISGNTMVTFTYPDDFTLVSGSGTLTVNLLNAYSTLPNKIFMFGTLSTGTPLGNNLSITSNTVSKTLEYGGGGNVLFTGGYPIVVGGFIDVNGNGNTTHMADDGDYLASQTVTVAGDTVVVFTY